MKALMKILLNNWIWTHVVSCLEHLTFFFCIFHLIMRSNVSDLCFDIPIICLVCLDSYPDSFIVIRVALIEWLVFVVVSFASLLTICINVRSIFLPTTIVVPKVKVVRIIWCWQWFWSFPQRLTFWVQFLNVLFEAGNWTIGVSYNGFNNNICFLLFFVFILFCFLVFWFLQIWRFQDKYILMNLYI